MPSKRCSAIWRHSPRATCVRDSDPVATYGAFAKRLNEAGIAYIEVVEDSFQGNLAEGRPQQVIDAIQANFKGPNIGNGHYTADEARQRIQAWLCDLASFGRPFISNPDLPERFRQGATLNDWDSSSFYGGDERGYTDYPAPGSTSRRDSASLARRRLPWLRSNGAADTQDGICVIR